MCCQSNHNSCSTNSCSCHNGCSCGCCSCGCCSCCCHQGSCGCHHKCNESNHHDSFAHEFLKLADEAWMEVVKEKIKEEILKNDGTRLTELAKLNSATNNKKWSVKMNANHSCHEFEDQLKKILGGCCSDKGKCS